MAVETAALSLVELRIGCYYLIQDEEGLAIVRITKIFNGGDFSCSLLLVVFEDRILKASSRGGRRIQRTRVRYASSVQREVDAESVRRVLLVSDLSPNSFLQAESPLLIH